MACESKPVLGVKTGQARQLRLGAATAYSNLWVGAPRQCPPFSCGEAETPLAVSTTLFHYLSAKRARTIFFFFFNSQNRRAMWYVKSIPLLIHRGLEDALLKEKKFRKLIVLHVWQKCFWYKWCNFIVTAAVARNMCVCPHVIFIYFCYGIYGMIEGENIKSTVCPLQGLPAVILSGIIFKNYQ